MTDAELRALCEAATPGPWGVAYTSAGEAKIVVGDKGIALLRHAWESSPDAAFIAAARTEVPRLLSEKSALEGRVAELEKALAASRIDHDGSSIECCRWFFRVEGTDEREPCSCNADEHNARIDAALAGEGETR